MNSTTIVSAQDKGPRENLEDDFGAFSLSLPGPKPLDVTVALLADGVGGAQHGEVASAMTIREVKSSLAASIAGLDPKTDSHALDAGSIFNLLDEALRAANTAVLAKTDEDLENKGMSTTVVCAVIKPTKIWKTKVCQPRSSAPSSPTRKSTLPGPGIHAAMFIATGESSRSPAITARYSPW